MKRTIRIIVTAVASVVAPLAVAGDIYKCPTPSGKIEFRDRPCDNAGGQKMDVKENTSGSMNLETVRAKSAELKAKRQAKQKAEDSAATAEQEAFLRERAHLDALETQSAIRESTEASNAAANAAYWNSMRQQQPVKVQVNVQPTTPAAPSKSSTK